MEFAKNTIISNEIAQKNSAIFQKNFDQNLLYICIDWLQFTLKNITLNEVIEFLKLSQYPSSNSDSGVWGYNRTITYFEKVKIMYRVDLVKGEYLINDDYGYHVVLSGRACREYEKILPFEFLFVNLFNKYCHKEYLEAINVQNTDKLLKDNKGFYYWKWFNCNITRIDYAIDYFNKDLVYIKKILNCVKSAVTTSRFKSARNVEDIDIDTGKILGNSLYFGSINSSLRFVFYDKLQERKESGYIVADNVKFWERCEIRFKHEKACESLIYLNTQNFSIGSLLQGVLLNYIQFRIKNTKNKDKTKWDISKWWLEFCNNVKPIRLTQYSIQSTLQKKKEYVDTHWTSLISELFIAEYENRNEFIFKLISNPKVDNKALVRQNQYRISKGQSILSMEQYQEIIKCIKDGLAIAGIKTINEIINTYND